MSLNTGYASFSSSVREDVIASARALVAGASVSGSVLGSSLGCSLGSSLGSALSVGAVLGSSLVTGSVSAGLFSVPQALSSAKHMVRQRTAAMIFFIFHFLLGFIPAARPPSALDLRAAKKFPRIF